VDFTFILTQLTHFTRQLAAFSGRSPDLDHHLIYPFPHLETTKTFMGWYGIGLTYTVAGPSGNLTRFPILPCGHLKYVFIYFLSFYSMFIVVVKSYLKARVILRPELS
jgi:hypothetical protein